MWKPPLKCPRGAGARAARGRTPAVVLATVLLLAACGQKGPLWMPGHAKDTPWPIAPPPKTPAPGTEGQPVPAGAPATSGSGATGGRTPQGAAVPSADNPAPAPDASTPTVPEDR